VRFSRRQQTLLHVQYTQEYTARIRRISKFSAITAAHTGTDCTYNMTGMYVRRTLPC
jgi:hypothetical protein